MTSLKNKWMVLFIVGMSAITIFGTLLTSNDEIRVKDNHNTEYNVDM